MTPACASIACGACPRPGRCCTGFVLNGGMVPHEAATALEAQLELDAHGLPFSPLMRRPATGHWMLWCRNLTREGRCGDYENRPQLCADYQPGEDALCAMHRAADSPPQGTP